MVSCCYGLGCLFACHTLQLSSKLQLIGSCPACSTGAILHRCVVTKSSYTEDEDFTKADAVYDCIGDEGDERFTYAELAQSLLQGSAA